MIPDFTSDYPSRKSSFGLFFRYAERVLLGFVLLSSAPVQAQSPEITKEFNQATQAMRDGKLDEAGAGFASVVKSDPKFAEAYFNLGLVREEEGRYEEAIPTFQKALSLQSRLHGANLFLGISQFQLNHLSEAAAAVQKETVAFPKDANAWMWLGVVRLAQDRAEDAADALDRADKLKPGDQDILYHRGRAHLLVSKDSYAEMFKIDPHSWRVHRVLAQANAEADRHIEAIEEYQAAIKLAPNQTGLHEELGSEYMQADKLPEAEAALQRELQIDPHNVLATYKLGVLAVDQHDGARAKELIETARRTKPTLVHIDYNLGRAEMLLGDDAAAIPHFELAIKTDRDREVVAQTWYQLGVAYRHLKRMDDAQSAMAEFQKLKDEEADRSQQRMKKLVSPDNNPSAAPTDAEHPD